MTKISWRFLSWLAWALLVCATASTFYTSSAAQLPKLPKFDPFPKIADAALTKYINANQPIDYNYGELFPQVVLPGTAFVQSNGAQVAAESAQLAQSANGEIDLAPGDYALPVRLYCTHIYTGTAPGLNYLLAQLNGKRAHVITMLTARVGNKSLPYQPVQVLSWAIQNGQKYGDLTPALRKLVDNVIPDQRAALGDDLVEQIRAYWNDYVRGHRGMPDFDAELHRLGPAGDQILKYERAKNAMSQHPDDFEALRNEFILEGQAPAAQGSDPPWSQVRPGVLERLIPPEGRWLGGVGTLQIRVLPTSAPTVAVPVTDIIGYPPNSMQPVTFSIVDLPGKAPEKASSAPVTTGSSAPAPTSSSAPAATGCGGRPFSGQLRLSVTGFDSSTGKIAINGVDVRRPGTPFTWNWGDGTTTQGWFPQSYTYAEPHGDYTIQVISHEDAGPSDCAQLTVRFPSAGNAAPPSTSPLLNDDFASAHSLNDSFWTTSGEIVKSRILKADTRFVPVRLAFSGQGMTMTGVNGRYQSTGIQSTQSFSPPLTLEATVMGTISNGNPLALYLVRADGKQFLAVNANLDSQNGGFWFGHTGTGNDSGNEQRVSLVTGASVGNWYVVRLVIDAHGIGTVSIGDRQGNTLARQDQLDVGTGPFFVALAQWAGYPRTQGPNEAVWASVALSSTAHQGATTTVSSSAQCPNPGTIRILSGTGAFAAVSSTKKEIVASPGESIDGTLELGVTNNGPAFAIAPLIWLPSWGEPSASWRLIESWVRPGESSFTAHINVRVPSAAGLYHIMMAFQLEKNGANVASGTNWARGQPIWGDGNDIAQFSSRQIEEAQRYGCTSDDWLFDKGFQPVSVPADAISLEVRSGADSQATAAGPNIVKAIVAKGAASLELPPGRMYLYGMSTGGGAPSSQFTAGQYADAKNAAGLLSDALAYGTNSQNSYTTQTAYHDIGGVSVAGSWEHFASYYGANHQSGAHDASVSFQTNEDSLVVVLGLASSQQFVSVEGIPNLQVDASRSGGGIVIAHANVKPGSYNVVEHSKVLAAGQDPAHMADLVGVFVFGGKQGNEMPATGSERAPAASASGASNGNIRSVDFQNFEYRTNCLSENDAPQVVRVANGQANNQDGQFWADKPVYGSFKGDSHELAAVAITCHPADMSPNVGFSEVLVFEMSESGPKVLAKLPPSFWKQARVTGLKVSNQQLAADFLEMGMGSNACPEWIVTSKLRWNGTSFVNAGESRRKNSCAR
jgi:hypothetical protein